MIVEYSYGCPGFVQCPSLGYIQDYKIGLSIPDFSVTTQVA